VNIDSNVFLREHQKIGAAYPIYHKNIPFLLMSMAKKFGESVFCIFPGEVLRKFTYDDLFTEVLRKRKVLQNLGLKKGDSLSIVLPNSSDFISLYFSSLSLGLVVVPINPELNLSEIGYIARNSRSKLLIYDDALRSKISIYKEMDGFPITLYPVSQITAISADKLIDTQDKYEADSLGIRVTDLAVIIYTSGTTGSPKGVLLSHLNLLADSQAIKDWFDFSENTRTLCILPLFHNNGQVVTLLAPLMAGGSTVIVRANSSLPVFWDLIKEFEITFTSLMSSILSILIATPSERRDSTLGGIICGGQVLLPSVQELFESRFKVPIYEGFGLTETTSFACFNDFPKGERKLGSIGKPLPCNEIQLIDEQGTLIESPNVVGQIIVRGYNVCIEYLDLPLVNKSKFFNGWFHTGDYGYKDEEGYLYFKGRKDFLIFKGGENIYPSEIENAIYLNHAVSDVAAIGIDSKLLGQEIVVFVKLKDGSKVDEVNLMQHCKLTLAKYKVPKKIYILDKNIGLEDMPRGPTKKTLYNELHKIYQERLSHE